MLRCLHDGGGRVWGITSAASLRGASQCAMCCRRTKQRDVDTSARKLSFVSSFRSHPCPLIITVAPLVHATPPWHPATQTITASSLSRVRPHARAPLPALGRPLPLLLHPIQQLLFTFNSTRGHAGEKSVSIKPTSLNSPHLSITHPLTDLWMRQPLGRARRRLLELRPRQHLARPVRRPERQALLERLYFM